MKQVAIALDRHRDAILRWFDSTIANGLVEGINGPRPGRQAEGQRLPLNTHSQGHRLSIAGKLDLRLPDDRTS